MPHLKTDPQESASVGEEENVDKKKANPKEDANKLPAEDTTNPRPAEQEKTFQQRKSAERIIALERQSSLERLRTLELKRSMGRRRSLERRRSKETADQSSSDIRRSFASMMQRGYLTPYDRETEVTFFMGIVGAILVLNWFFS